MVEYDVSKVGIVAGFSARRQKHQGIHWSEQTSHALAALGTLMLNSGRELYWQNHQVLPLAVPVEF